MIANTNAPSPPSERSAPAGSSGVFASSRDSGANVQIAMNVRATSGRFTSTAEPHHHRSSSAPDTIGPIAPPAPANPAHTTMARERYSGGKIVVMIESVAGITNAAPLPMTPRPAITWLAPAALPATMPPSPTTTTTLSNGRLRPTRPRTAPAARRFCPTQDGLARRRTESRRGNHADDPERRAHEASADVSAV